MTDISSDTLSGSSPISSGSGAAVGTKTSRQVFAFNPLFFTNFYFQSPSSLPCSAQAVARDDDQLGKRAAHLVGFHVQVRAPDDDHNL